MRSCGENHKTGLLYRLYCIVYKTVRFSKTVLKNNVFPARPDRASRGKLDSLCLSSIAINEGFISFISGDLLVCLPRQINNFLIRFRNIIKPSALKTQNQSENLLVKIFNSKIFRNFCLHNLKRRLLASLMM